MFERMFGSGYHEYWEPPVSAASEAVMARIGGDPVGESGGGGAVAGGV